MAKADQIKALVRSHAAGDDTRFYSIALQVAASAARNGHKQVAQELRDLIQQARDMPTNPVTRPVPLSQPRGELAELISASYPSVRLGSMVLAQGLQAKLKRIVLEQRQRARLVAHGFYPARKLLLIGPPGTGKTMTAAALAGELGLPLFDVRVESLMSKYMGETATKLRVVFDSMLETRGVFFFDEFDSLGSQRGLSNDVGEVRRVLNAFLQWIERDTSECLILGATNHVKLLDPALFRRFDGVLEYELPDSDVVLAVMRSRLSMLDTQRVEWSELLQLCQGLSHAEITRACEQAAKDVLLDQCTSLSTQHLLAALEDRRMMRP